MIKKTKLEVEDVLKVLEEFVSFEEHKTLTINDEFTLNDVKFKVSDVVCQRCKKLLWVYMKGDINQKYKIHFLLTKQEIRIEVEPEFELEDHCEMYDLDFDPDDEYLG